VLTSVNSKKTREKGTEQMKRGTGRRRHEKKRFTVEEPGARSCCPTPFMGEIGNRRGSSVFASAQERCDKKRDLGGRIARGEGHIVALTHRE